MKIRSYTENLHLPHSRLQADAMQIFDTAVSQANPYENTCKALQKAHFGKVRLVLSIGKAAVPMMQAVYDTLGADNITEAVLVTKHGHLKGFCAEK